jgi:hypothetical protein
MQPGDASTNLNTRRDATNVRHLRRAQGETQGELADAAGIDIRDPMGRWIATGALAE